MGQAHRYASIMCMFLWWSRYNHDPTCYPKVEFICDVYHAGRITGRRNNEIFTSSTTVKDILIKSDEIMFLELYVLYLSYWSSSVTKLFQNDFSIGMSIFRLCFDVPNKNGTVVVHSHIEILLFLYDNS
jgi:hypothetical protein